MVDLVKIRKKKAKQKEDAAAAEQQAGQQTDAPADASPAPAPAAAEVAEPAKALSRPEQEPAAIAAADDPAASRTPASSKLERFKSEAGKRRGSDAGAAAEEEQRDGRLELLTFVIAGEHYAIDIEKIVEIVTPRAVTRIPNADPTIVGILSLRGTIVTLVDVRRKLRHGSEPAETADTRIVVIDFRNEIVGFIVDRVLRVVKTDASGIEPHPVVHATELDSAIRGVFRSGNALTILLDLDKLLDHNTSAGVTA